MKVVIDAQALIKKKTGIGTYGHHLIQHLSQYDCDLVLAKPNSDRDLKTPQRIMWEALKLPRLARAKRADLIHTIGFSAPIYKPCKVVSTVFDLIGMIFPENLGFASRIYWKRWQPFSFKFSNYIITSSENTKKDIVRYLRYPSEKISVILLAVDERFVPMNKETAYQMIKSYIPFKKYFLFVGTLEPRKNIKNMLLAYSKLSNDVKQEYGFVFIGKQGWGGDALFQLCEQLKLNDRAVFLDYVPGSHLPAFYNAASCFVFPSFYEGFGLPVLEAMSCGLPVICSNVSSLPEVTGDAAYLIDPHSVQEIKESMQKILFNDSLSLYYAKKGLERSKLFSWERVARETYSIYQKVIIA